MVNNDLGYFRDYGHIILSLCLILWGCLYTYLSNEYGEIDNE